MSAQVQGNVKIMGNGKRAILHLEMAPTDAHNLPAEASTAIVPRAKRGPDMDDLLTKIAAIGQVHKDREPVTKSSLRMAVSNVQAKRARLGLGGDWDSDATEMVSQILSQPLRKRARATPTKKSSSSSTSSSSSSEDNPPEAPAVDWESKYRSCLQRLGEVEDEMCATELALRNAEDENERLRDQLRALRGF